MTIGIMLHRGPFTMGFVDYPLSVAKIRDHTAGSISHLIQLNAGVKCMISMPYGVLARHTLQSLPVTADFACEIRTNRI